jgi:hypothetical protein
MARSTAASAVLLLAGVGCLLAGVWIVAGLGWALVVTGVLLIAADWLVPSR